MTNNFKRLLESFSSSDLKELMDGAGFPSYVKAMDVKVKNLEGSQIISFKIDKEKLKEPDRKQFSKDQKAAVNADELWFALNDTGEPYVGDPIGYGSRKSAEKVAADFIKS